MEFENSIPIYIQLVEAMKLQIIAGRLKPGDRIPSVRELALVHKVNPNTMQKALLMLEREGLLVTRGTAGRWVTDSAEQLEAARCAAIDRLVCDMVDDAREAGIGLDELIEKIKNGWSTI